MPIVMDREDNQRRPGLLLDVGNSAIQIGLVHDKVDEVRRIFPDDVSRIQNFWEEESDGNRPGFLLISSVNRRIEEQVRSAVSSFVNPEDIARYRRDFPPQVEVDVPDPSGVGDDRLLNVTGAWLGYGAPAIVVDCGTAITVDVLKRGGVFAGGTITPGIRAAMRALSEQCEQLSEQEPQPTEEPYGRTTAGAINAGIYHGFSGLIRRITGNIKDSMDGNPTIIGTGGEIEMLNAERTLFDTIDNRLTVKGLFWSWKREERENNRSERTP